MGIIHDFFDNKIPDILQIQVTPKASSNRITTKTNDDGSHLIRIYLTEIAEDGKANKALIKILAKDLHLPIRAFEIIRGLKSRQKTVRITK